jgi:DNA-binding IclR family transcriptional regulator
MIYLSAIKRQILTLMRESYGEHLGTSDIAGRLDEPLFRIRAELLDLARYRLVRQDTSRRRLEWALTELGEGVSWGEQLELEGWSSKDD